MGHTRTLIHSNTDLTSSRIPVMLHSYAYITQPPDSVSLTNHHHHAICLYHNFAAIMFFTLCGSSVALGYGKTSKLICLSPPSTTSTVPVIHIAAGENRNTAAAAMSSTEPIRPSGIGLSSVMYETLEPSASFSESDRCQRWRPAIS
jgi:hypothetical protein